MSTYRQPGRAEAASVDAGQRASQQAHASLVHEVSFPHEEFPGPRGVVAQQAVGPLPKTRLEVALRRRYRPVAQLVSFDEPVRALVGVNEHERDSERERDDRRVQASGHDGARRRQETEILFGTLRADYPTGEPFAEQTAGEAQVARVVARHQDLLPPLA